MFIRAAVELSVAPSPDERKDLNTLWQPWSMVPSSPKKTCQHVLSGEQIEPATIFSRKNFGKTRSDLIAGLIGRVHKLARRTELIERAMRTLRVKSGLPNQATN